MKGFRNRILLPLAIPVGATVFIVMVVFNFSRILLLLEERRSAAVATMLAIVAATGVLVSFVWLANRSESRTAGMSLFATTGIVLVFAGGYSFGAAGEGEGHAEEKAPAGGTVNVSGKEFAFDPKEASVPTGPVTFNLTNTGKVVHTILIEGVPELVKIVAPKAGAATGTVDLKPGKYVFFCDETGHRKAGMEATLTVTEGGEGGGGGGAKGGEANVSGKEFAFDPKEVTVPAGPVKINLTNTGKVVHTILIEGVPELVKIVAPKAGAATGTVDLKPGKYVFFCDETGHRKAGMEGTLTVTEGGGGGGGGAKKPSGGATKDVVGKEFAFDPKEISVPAGPLKINLKNEGKVVHTFLVDGRPELATLKAEKGGTATGTFDLAPGTYTFFCNETGHRKAGMEGKLTVG